MPTGVFIPIPTKPGQENEIRSRLKALDLQRYVGGQAEDHVDGGILNGGKVYRGDVEYIAIEGDELVIRFVWLGVMVTPGSWTSDSELELRFNLVLIESCYADQGRIVIQAPIVDQLVVLFPPNYAVDGVTRSLARSDVH